MLEKLRAHLRKSEGFTLIELLVVIAIIAILVIIVVVAINPVQRLQDASDRRAAANTRSAGTLVSTCITLALSGAGATETLDDCDTEGEIETIGDGNWPATASYADNNAAGTPTNICAIEEGQSGVFWRYQSVTGEVDDAATSLTDCT